MNKLTDYYSRVTPTARNTDTDGLSLTDGAVTDDPILLHPQQQQEAAWTSEDTEDRRGSVILSNASPSDGPIDPRVLYGDDADVDLPDEELQEFYTQRNCSQVPDVEDSDDDGSDEESKQSHDEDGDLEETESDEEKFDPTDLTQTELTQSEEPLSRQVTLGDYEPHPQTSIPHAKRHKSEPLNPFQDSQSKVFLNVGLNGIRVFCLGEAYTSRKRAWKLCKQNIVPAHVENKASYVIRKLLRNRKKKTAECEVAIPFSDTLFDRKVKSGIKQEGVDFYVFLRHTEEIRLSDLDNRTEPPAMLERPIMWETGSKKGKSAVGWEASYKIREPKEKTPDHRQPTMLDIFAGCGGISHAFAQSNYFNVKWIVEKNRHAADSHRLNLLKKGHMHTQVFEDDVWDFLAKCKLGYAGDPRYGMYPKPGDIDHIHSSSPCNGFSDANISGGANDETNNMLCFVLIEYIKFFNPLTASFENVTGMLRDQHVNYFDKLIARIVMEAGYQARAGILRASDLGDPQHRPRVFLLLAKPGIQLPEFPKATHGEGLKPYVTPEAALRDLEDVEPETGSGLVCLGDVLIEDHGIDAAGLKGGSDVLSRNVPARTVRTAKGVTHYSRQRNVTVRELARIQSFPDSFVLCGSMTEKRKQIGNAVPICLGTAIAEAIKYLGYPTAPVTSRHKV